MAQIIIEARPARATRTVTNRLVVYPVGEALNEKDLSGLNEVRGFHFVAGTYDRHGYDTLVKAKVSGTAQYYLVNFGYRE